MALETGSEHRLTDSVFHHFGLQDYFQAIVRVDEVAAHKLAPETVRGAELLEVGSEVCRG